MKKFFSRPEVLTVVTHDYSTQSQDLYRGDSLILSSSETGSEWLRFEFAKDGRLHCTFLAPMLDIGTADFARWAKTFPAARAERRWVSS